MKKWILSAAFIIALSGYAAAQATSSEAASKTAEKAVKKEPVKKTGTAKKTTVKKEATVQPTKLPIALAPIDTVGIPKGKNDQ
jgi:hypothetical protein